jgi:prepilin-type N-terminal cleavage/methylation domain-containing protein
MRESGKCKASALEVSRGVKNQQAGVDSWEWDVVTRPEFVLVWSLILHSSMKTPLIRRQRGFTLVELLVVVTIIIILAAAGFAGAMKALARAKTVRAQAALTAVEQAVNQFYNEYGRLPAMNNATADAQYDTALQDGQKLLEPLLGKEDTTSGSTIQNTKQLSFLSVPGGKTKGTGGIDGLVYEAGSAVKVRGLYDPWGRPYKIMLDNDYDEELTVNVAGTPKYLHGRRVAVWSLGPDGKSDDLKTAADDVKNW